MLTESKISYLNDCLKRRLLLFTGKGGVGKSAVAWATALALQRQNRRVRFASWSPFDSQSDTFPLAQFGIHWEQLDALSAFKEYVMKALRFEKIYDVVFENRVLKAFIQAAPGLSETVIAGKVWNLYEQDEQDTLIVDLPSSGHALSFFKSPLGVEKIFSVGFVHREAHKISEMFLSPSTRLDIVTLPEEMPMVESLQFKEKLTGIAALPLGFLLVNQNTPIFPLPSPLPPLSKEVAGCLESYRLRKTREEKALELAANVGLPQVRIPRFSTEGFKETIESIATFLEHS